jgi:8-oxo-dGTP diphosphatase/2-hydroxy-dATP diphosphatase
MLRKILTLVLILQDEKILLGMKKRGFGAGRWNGFGGKVREDESIEDAAKREVKEECGLEIKRLEEVGVHEFEFVKERGTILEVHVFRGLSWQGEPFETEEMRPKWFLTSKIPYQDMWPDDILWLPTFLEGKKFRTKFLFGDGDQVLEQKIEVVT